VDAFDLRPGLIAFVDLLGFSEKVKNARLNKDRLRRIAREVTTVKKTFDSRPSSAILNERAFKKKIIVFSDCVVLVQPIAWPIMTGGNTLELLTEGLRFIALAQAECASRGYFLRGGVDIGFWYYRNNTFISAALVDAYQCEQDAQNPVIALTENLTFILARLPRKPNEPPRPEPLDLVRQFKNTKGRVVTYLDYIDIVLNELPSTSDARVHGEHADSGPLGGNRFRYLTKGRWLARHEKVVQQGYSKATRTKIRRKYEFLLAYHREKSNQMKTNTRRLLRSGT
jgi:hypothetical protein